MIEQEEIRFRPLQRKNPFENPLLAFLTHGLATGAAGPALYFSLSEGTLFPLYLAGAFISILEGMWLYYTLRR